MARVQPVTVRLCKPLSAVLRAGHPWIYRDALRRFEAPAGAVATVVDGRGRFVARGVVDDGPIGVRVFTTRDEPLGRTLLQQRIEHALRWRAQMLLPETDALRLIHGEGDRIPGLVCDQYGSSASVRLDGAGAEAWRDVMLDALVPHLMQRGIETIVLRTGRRGTQRVETIRGDPPPGPLAVQEYGMTLLLDLRRGQKTGMFLDHRESRRRVRLWTRGLRVLDLFAYVGGFSAAAGLGGAREVVTVDVAPAAIELARRCWVANGLPDDAQRAHARDVFDFLEGLGKDDRFDMIIADPPSFAPREQVLPRALRSYRKLHRAALRRLRSGGLYLAASCSSHIDRQRFEQSLFDAATKQRRMLQVVDRWEAPPDHPRLAAFPEGDYLKVLLVRLL